MKTKEKNKRNKTKQPRQMKARALPRQKSSADKYHADTAEQLAVLETLPEPEATKKKSKTKIIEVPVPAVYRQQGYLFLTLQKHGTRVSFLEVSTGERKQLEAAIFVTDYHPVPIPPYALILNLIARAVLGTLESSVHVYRRLIEMALNKQQLMDMDTRQLAREYSRLMAFDKPISQISKEDKERFVDTLLLKLAEEGERLEHPSDPVPDEAAENIADKATSTATAAPASVPDDAPKDKKKSNKATTSTNSTPVTKPATNTPKGLGMGTKKGSKKPKALSGAAAAKKKAGAANAKTAYPATKAKNPFREGSKKEKCFALFAKGGERGAILAGMKKLGITEATAATWLNLFRKVKG